MRRVLSLVITVLFAVQLLLLSASGQVYPEQTVSDGLWRFVVDDAVTYPEPVLACCSGGAAVFPGGFDFAAAWRRLAD